MCSYTHGPLFPVISSRTFGLRCDGVFVSICEFFTSFCPSSSIFRIMIRRELIINGGFLNRHR